MHKTSICLRTCWTGLTELAVLTRLAGRIGPKSNKHVAATTYTVAACLCTHSVTGSRNLTHLSRSS